MPWVRLATNSKCWERGASQNTPWGGNPDKGVKGERKLSFCFHLCILVFVPVTSQAVTAASGSCYHAFSSMRLCPQTESKQTNFFINLLLIKYLVTARRREIITIPMMLPWLIWFMWCRLNILASNQAFSKSLAQISYEPCVGSLSIHALLKGFPSVEQTVGRWAFVLCDSPFLVCLITKLSFINSSK